MIGRVANWMDRAVGETALAMAVRKLPPRAIPDWPRSILVLRNNDLGDVLIVTPLFEALRSRFPETRVCAAVGTWAMPLLEGNPHLSGVIEVDAPWFNKYVRRRSPMSALRFAWRSQAVERLRKERFEVGIDLLGSAWGALLLLRSGVATRLGTLGYAGGERGFQGGVLFDPGEHVGRRALRFAELLGATNLPENRPQLFLSQREKAAGEQVWGQLRQDTGTRRLRVAIGPGAGLPQKAWPEERFRDLVARLAASRAFELVVLGSPGDRPLADRIAAGTVPNLAGEKSLREMIAVVAAADCVVCNSSLLLHASAAFGKRSIVVLGLSFSSAAQHQQQWGYDGYSVTLGPERGSGQGLASVEEAVARVERAAALPVGAAFR